MLTIFNRVAVAKDINRESLQRLEQKLKNASIYHEVKTKPSTIKKPNPLFALYVNINNYARAKKIIERGD